MLDEDQAGLDARAAADSPTAGGDAPTPYLFAQNENAGEQTVEQYATVGSGVHTIAVQIKPSVPTVLIRPHLHGTAIPQPMSGDHVRSWQLSLSGELAHALGGSRPRKLGNVGGAHIPRSTTAGPRLTRASEERRPYAPLEVGIG